MNDFASNLFPEQPETSSIPVSAPPAATEEVILRISCSILHLIDQSYSVELACGDFAINRIIQDGNVIAVLAHVADEIQWLLTKDENSVKIMDRLNCFNVQQVSEEAKETRDDYGLAQLGK